MESTNFQDGIMSIHPPARFKFIGAGRVEISSSVLGMEAPVLLKFSRR
jgi:hypothetical protein